MRSVRIGLANPPLANPPLANPLFARSLRCSFTLSCLRRPSVLSLVVRSR